MTRAEIQQKIVELEDRASVEEWVLNELGEKVGADVCDDLDTYDWMVN